MPDTTLLTRPYKMIVYINKNGCTNCKLRSLLPIYLFTLKTMKSQHFGVVVILNTPNIEATKGILMNLRFKYTVFFDTNNSFEQLNPQLPNDELFHTFLINSENKPILIGSPTHNEKLNNLYLQEIKKGGDKTIKPI